MSSSENHLHRKVTLWSLGKKWGNKPGESQLNSQFWVLVLLSTEQKISAHFSLFSNLDDKVLWRTSCLLLEGTVSENKRVKWEFWGSMGRKLFQDNLNPCTLNRLRMRTMEAKILCCICVGPPGNPETSCWYDRLCLHSLQNRKRIKIFIQGLSKPVLGVILAVSIVSTT